MADTEGTGKKRRGVFGAIRGALFEDVPDTDAPSSAPEPPLEDADAIIARYNKDATSASAGNGSAPAATDGASAVMTADFPTIYAQLGVSGDPTAITVMEAYAGMPEAARAAAIGPMIKAMRADPKSLIATVEAWITTLGTVRDEQEKAVAERLQQRSTAASESKGAKLSKIQSLRDQIAALEGEIREEEAMAKRANDGDTGTLEGFKSRAASEVAKLAAFRDFLQKGIK